jgi:hypothetical protein
MSELTKEKVVKGKVAIFCVHGMGQQMRFTTLDNVAQGIHGVTEVTHQQASLFELDGRVRQRLEMTVKKWASGNEESSKESELHLYEAYWASITEGQVSLIDVMQFLIGAGWNGIQQSFRPFKRWMFDKFNEISIHPATFWYIALTLFVVLLLSVLNAGAVLLTYGVLFGKELPEWLPKNYINLTTLILAWLSMGISFIGVLWFALIQRKALWKAKPTRKRLWVGRVIGMLALALGLFLFGWTSIWGVVCRILMIILGVAILSLFFWFPKTLPSQSKLWKGYTFGLDILVWVWLGAFVLAGLFFAGSFIWIQFNKHALDNFVGGIDLGAKPWLFWITWIPIFLLSYIVRRFLVEYIGDVAAYISPHKLDRFAKIRADIQTEAISVLKHIYTQPDYDRIILVGHSLGSVIAYDALNSLLAEAELKGQVQVKDYVDRTKLLLTFGSPLDKTAFVFATRGGCFRSTWTIGRG